MQSGRVPFRVEGSRKFVLGSLAGHVGITLLFATLGAAFLSPPPPLQLVKVNLQTLELPREVPTRPEPVVETRQPEPEPVAEEVEPDPVPPPPEEVRTDTPVPTPDTSVAEDTPANPEPVAPEFELPREARPTPEVVPEDVDEWTSSSRRSCRSPGPKRSRPRSKSP